MSKCELKSGSWAGTDSGGRAATRATALLACAACLLFPAPETRAQWSLDLEGGGAWCGSNDVAIPGDTGTRFSLTNDLEAETGGFWRARLGYRLAPRHALSLLAAPLTLRASGEAPRDLTFQDEVFPAGTPLDATYTFNSYRLTYRYALKENARWFLGAGFTAKIRDAAVRVEGGGASSEKANVGFVPLLHVRGERRFPGRATLVLEADALAAPQGRAEDVFLGAEVRVSGPFALKGGYRFVEGGADNDKVYNFAWIHYAVIGLVIERPPEGRAAASRPGGPGGSPPARVCSGAPPVNARLRPDKGSGGPKPAARRFFLSPDDVGRGFLTPRVATCRMRSASP